MESTQSKTILFCMLAILLWSSACSILPTTVSITQPAGAETVAAQTLAAMFATSTRQAERTMSAQATASYYPPTITLAPPLPTWTATYTPILPSATPVPPSATATSTSAPCNRAELVQELNVPAGSDIPANGRFTKVWRVKNTGSCTWSTSYALIYAGGDKFAIQEAIAFPGSVVPGQSVDLALDLRAPNVIGQFRSTWALRDAYGEIFDLDSAANKRLVVDISVSAAGSSYPFKLANMVCAAAWSSAVGFLPCPGNQESEDGSIILLNRPNLETGKQEDEPTLWTRSQRVSNGWIRGVFPSLKIQNGDYFLTEVGCLDNYTGCDVTFNLGYQIGDGPILYIGSWREVFDGKVTRIDFDLSSLAGQAVRLVLSMVNNGDPKQAHGYWLVPSIRQFLPTPTPTVTPIPTNDPYPAIQAARQAVAQGVGVDISQVSVFSVVERAWSNSCLELPNPGEVCLPIITAGYRIILFVGTQEYEAHTNLDGTIVRWTAV